MRGAQFAEYELYSCTDACADECTDMCTDVYVYIAGLALYMYVHDLANPLADNVIFEHSRGFVFETFECSSALR